MHIYKDKDGNRPIADYIKDLANKQDKDSRIKFHKIRDYLKYLSQDGKQAKRKLADQRERGLDDE